MSKLFLNLSHMRKVKEGKDTTVFEHKDGHSIHVKNSALSPKMRDEMQRLSLGKGKAPVKMAEGGTPCKNPACKSCGQEHPNCRCYAAGGPVRYSDGGAVDKDDKTKTVGQIIGYPGSDPSPAPKMFALGTDNIQDSPEQILADAAGAPPPESATDQVAPASAFQMSKGADPTAVPQPDSGKSLLDYVKPGSALSEEQKAANAAAAPKAQEPIKQDDGSAGPESMPSPPQASSTPPGFESGVAKGIQEQREGIDKEAQARGLQSQQTLQGLQQGAADKAKDDSFYQNQQTNLLSERDNLMKDYAAGHINPDAFISDKSVPGKISTAIGLILGGIGGGLLHQENPALKFLNAQIDRNINAQQAELGKKHNLLGANYQQFQNLQSARDFTRVNHNDMIKNLVDQAAAKAGTPMAQAEALKLKGQLDQNSGMLMAKIGAMNTINHSAAGEGDINSALQTLRFTDPEKAKEVEGRLVPNVGITQVPLDASTRAKIVERNTLDKNINELISFQKQYGGTLSGIVDPTVRAHGEALARQVQDQYRRGNDQGVFKPAEAQFVNGVIGDHPSALFSKFTKLPGYQSAKGINQGNLKELYGSVGMRPFNQPQTGSVAQPPKFVPAKTFKPRQ